MIQKACPAKKPGDKDMKGSPIPKYIVHGGPKLAERLGLSNSQCQFFDEEPSSEEHRKRRDAMWERRVAVGAEHVYP